MGTKFNFCSFNFLKSSFNSVFLLSAMVILLWHKTILSRFKVFPFMAFLTRSYLLRHSSLQPQYPSLETVSHSQALIQHLLIAWPTLLSLWIVHLFFYFPLLFKKSSISFSCPSTQSQQILENFNFSNTSSFNELFNKPKRCYGLILGEISVNAQ